jgi:hypothetical protein
MFTATFPTALSQPCINNVFPHAQFSARANPDTSFVMYSRYRELATSLIDTNSPEIFYRAFSNMPESFNGEGMHEKFIYRGQSVLDISVGLLDFPWYAGDSSPLNEITFTQLMQLANSEGNPLVAHRLHCISNFAHTLPLQTRYYHYVGHDGMQAITINDEFNGIKMNCIITHYEDYIF